MTNPDHLYEHFRNFIVPFPPKFNLLPLNNLVDLPLRVSSGRGSFCFCSVVADPLDVNHELREDDPLSLLSFLECLDRFEVGRLR